MKKLFHSAFLATVAFVAYPQGQLVLDNLNNTSTSPTATANGLFWIETGGVPTLINEDFNAAFYAGTDSSSLSPVATFLLSNGTAAGDHAGPGRFFDPTGTTHTFPSMFSVFVQIQTWTGGFNSYAAALSAGAPAAQSPIFSNPVGVPPAHAPDLVNMPAVVLSVPEPSIFALAALGAVALIVRHRLTRQRS